jgi:hypothetical protein
MNAHDKRIFAELRAAGMTAYGLRKFNSRYLPNLIHEGESLRAVVYGRYIEAPGPLSWVDRMMVATDDRVILLNHKPGYSDVKEFGYSAIYGVEFSTAGPFSAVTLNTRIHGNISLRFVNENCARNFTHFMRLRLQLEQGQPSQI